jgi:hydroxymethylbilane synthase
MGKTYKIGTRPSKLALKQVEEILNRLKSVGHKINIEIKTIFTKGDEDKMTPISEIEGSDFFTDKIEEALLNKKIDFAVHSAKDLPEKIKKGLVIAAMTKSINPYDGFISKSGLTLKELPLHAKIGTSSIRRKEGLKKFRPDFQIIDIRGNIEERLAKLNNSDLDGIVIAVCALIRLGLKNIITQIIPEKIISPHPLQGRLAIETRDDNIELINMLSKLNNN